MPDGVLYLVEGAGGNRDFDDGFAAPRGSGAGLDQDDSATGTFTDKPGLTVPQGPASWLDTNLTNNEMASFLPNSGQGQKITARFKSKVFSFGHVVVADNKLTLFQVSEPLQSTSSATPSSPAPFGTDINGHPLNDPIPDTMVDPATGLVVSPPATGTPALLDKWTVTKPELQKELETMHSVGIGGVEIQPVYPLMLDDESKGVKNLSYLSPEFLDDVRFANDQLDDMVLLREPRPFSLHTSRQIMRMLGRGDDRWRKYLFY